MARSQENKHLGETGGGGCQAKAGPDMSAYFLMHFQNLFPIPMYINVFTTVAVAKDFLFVYFIELDSIKYSHN